MVKDEIIEVLRRYGDRLQEKNIKFQKLIVFGSYAEGRARVDSDIDVAVISENFGRDRFRERVLLTKIAYEIDARIEPHPVNLREFNEEGWQTLLHEIKQKGIEIAA